MVSINFEVWVKDFKVDGLVFRLINLFIRPRSATSLYRRWKKFPPKRIVVDIFFSKFWSLSFGFPEVFEGRGGFRKVREAERKNSHQFSPYLLRFCLKKASAQAISGQPFCHQFVTRARSKCLHLLRMQIFIKTLTGKTITVD